MEFELHLPLLAPKVIALVIGDERRTGTECHHQAVSMGGLGDLIRGQKIYRLELPQMRPELITFHGRGMFVEGKPTQPFNTNILVAFAECRPLSRMILIEI